MAVAGRGYASFNGDDAGEMKRDKSKLAEV
jgi:hypothetical protein